VHLGLSTSAALLRAAAAAGWPGLWRRVRCLWLRGLPPADFSPADVAALGCLPCLRELHTSCLPRGRPALAALPAGCLSQLTTLKLWWVG
jgi:hypothetical protein